MGSFSYLTINDYPIFNNKNSFFEEITSLIFLPEDFIVEQRKYSKKNILIWGDAYKSEKGNFTFKGFRQTAKICKQRLEIFGMTLQKAKKEFPLAKKIAAEDFYYTFPISKVSFSQYLNEISDIIQKKEINYDQLYTNLRDSFVLAP